MNSIFYQYFAEWPLLAYLFLFLVVVLAIVILVKAMQTIGMEKIRGYVYQLFIEAEHAFEQGENSQKFEYVIQLARSHLPMPFSLFITETLLRKVVQLWFDLCKDLLDDGRVNGTGGRDK